MLNAKSYILISFLFLSSLIWGQQDPQVTQYMNNMSVINPAYATDSPETINLGLLYRSQWASSVGGPQTGTLFGHMSLWDRMEGGISIVHDQIGDVVKQTNAFIDYAYILPINEKSKLSLGIKAGATFFSTNFNGFVYSDPEPDPAFAENLSKTFPNIGIGAFYFGENYYVGLSTPNLLRTKHIEAREGIYANGVEEIHFFLTGGYVFQLNKNLKFKPAFMTKGAMNSPVSLDLTSNFLINEIFEIGVGYRFDDSISGLMNFRLSPSLRVGYAYDYTLSNLGKFNNGSYELVVLIDINKLGKGYDISPRFF